MNLCYVVDEILVFVTRSDEASLLKAPQVPHDLPLLLLQRQLAVLLYCRAAFQTLRRLSILDSPALYNLDVLQLLQELILKRCRVRFFYMMLH